MYNGLQAYWPGMIELPERTVWEIVGSPAAEQK